MRGFVEPLPDRSGTRPVGTRSHHCRALAQACFAANVPEEATPCLAALERQEPAEAFTFVVGGLLAWAWGDLDACAAALATAEASAPHDALVQTALGRLHLRRR